MYKTVVVDLEYNEVANVIKNYCNMLDDVITEYQTCLSRLNAGANWSGKTQEALLEFNSYVYKLEGVLSEIGERINLACNNFLDDVIRAGDYLYDDKFNKTMVRNFSQKIYNDLLKDIDDSHESSVLSVTYWLDWLGDKIIGFFKFFGSYDIKKELTTHMKDTQLVLLDYNNDSKKFLQGVFDNVLEIDRKYGRIIEDNIEDNIEESSCGKMANKTLSTVKKILDNLSSIMDCTNGICSASEIQVRMTPLFSELTDCLNETRSFYADGMSVEQIEKFCQSYQNENFYYSYTGAIRELISELGIVDTASIVIFQGQTVSIDFLTKMFFVPDDVEKGDVYAYLVTKKQIADTLSKITNTNIEVPFEDSAKKAQDILEAIQKEDKSYPEYEEYKKFYDNINKVLGDAAKVLEKSVDVTEIILKVFQDYSSSIAIIESMNRNLDSHSLTYIALREIKKEYSNKYIACFKELAQYTVSEVTEKGVEEAEKAFTKKMVEVFVGKAAAKGAGGLLTIVDTAIDIVGEISGLGPKGKAYSDLAILNSQTSELNAVYNGFFQKVKMGDTSEATISGLKNSFAMLKESIIKEYDLAEKIAESERKYDLKAYYQYCGNTVAKANMSQTEGVELMSFKEYNSQF